MLKILGLFSMLGFAAQVSAQEVYFLTKEQARTYIQNAAKDPNLTVKTDEQGKVVEVKGRTEPTVDSEPDRVEESKDYNWQMMFGLGFNIGANFLTNGVAQQARLNDTNGDFRQYDFKLGFEAIVRPPHTRLRRWGFGASHSFANGQIGDKPTYYIPRKEGWVGEQDGLVPRDVGATRVTNYFVEYDALLLPGDDPAAAFSIGYFWGKARKDSDPETDYKLYSDQGVQMRFRTFHGAGLTPYVLVKLSNKRQHSFVFGLSVERGPKKKVPPKKTK